MMVDGRILRAMTVGHTAKQSRRPTGPVSSRQADLKLSILLPLVRYLDFHHGREALARASEDAGLQIADVLGGKEWADTRQVEAFCRFVDDLLQGDELAFRQAASFRLSEAYGPLRYILWATSPLTIFRQAVKNMHLVSAHGSYQMREESATGATFVYTSRVPEGRHLCLLRQANFIAMPTFWGLPPARFVEKSCLARGDDACEYDVGWAQPSRRWPLLLGLCVGLACGLGCIEANVLSSFSGAALASVCGATLGQLWELRRANRDNLEFAKESHGALEQLAGEESAARHELVALTQRQNEWSALMEQQLNERATALEKVIEQLEETRQEHITVLRGMSHDLRSPLTVLRTVADYSKLKEGQPVAEDLLDAQIGAVDRMDQILRELMDSSSATPHGRPVEELLVGDLTAQLRNQLRALTFGRDIRASVFCSREAPDLIQVDRLFFSRILDNLLSNAAKYTERGSIVVELDGQPGFLSIKISDSGRGIKPDEIEGIFQAGGSDENDRAPGSYGVGLSVVVRLLRRIDGRLEVMSKPAVGSTFWVFVPIKPQDKSMPERKTKGPLADVVRIRSNVSLG